MKELSYLRHGGIYHAMPCIQGCNGDECKQSDYMISDLQIWPAPTDQDDDPPPLKLAFPACWALQPINGRLRFLAKVSNMLYSKHFFYSDGRSYEGLDNLAIFHPHNESCRLWPKLELKIAIDSQPGFAVLYMPKELMEHLLSIRCYGRKCLQGKGGHYRCGIGIAEYYNTKTWRHDDFKLSADGLVSASMNWTGLGPKERPLCPECEDRRTGAWHESSEGRWSRQRRGRIEYLDEVEEKQAIRAGKQELNKVRNFLRKGV